MEDCDYDEFLPIDCVPAPIILPYFPLKAGGSSSQHQSPIDIDFSGALIQFQSPPFAGAFNNRPPQPTEGFEAENRDGSSPAPRRRRIPRQGGNLAGLPKGKKHRRAPILKRCLKKAGVEGKGWKRKKEDADDIDLQEEEEEATRGQRKSFEEAVLHRMDKIIDRLDKIINMSKCRRPT